MALLTVDNSYSRIEGLTPEQFEALSAELSIQEASFGIFHVSRKDENRLVRKSKSILFRDERGILRPVFSNRGVRHFKGYWHRSTSLIGKRGTFPTGLLHYAWVFLSKIKGLDIITKDTRKKPQVGLESTISLSMCPTPYPAQLDALEASKLLERGTISMPTGTGKSVTMALIINALKLKTLVVVPTLNLKQQLSDTFRTFFGPNAPIRVENIDSAALPTLTGYDLLLIDEAHHVAAATYQKLNKTAWKDIYYRYFFTATPFRSKDAEQLLFESIAGQILYRLSYRDSVESRYIVPIEAYYVELPKKEIEGSEVSWPNVYSELVVRNEARNYYIGQLMAALYSANCRTLVLVKEIAHGRWLSSLTGAAFANGQDKESDVFLEGFNNCQLKTLIATQGYCGEGVDTKPAEWIILASEGKSKNAFMQHIGRGVRRFGDKESCKVILFKDSSHKWMKEHYKAQLKFLVDEYGVVPVKLELESEGGV
jgi:superfamily II DNA or RNA helicase